MSAESQRERTRRRFIDDGDQYEIITIKEDEYQVPFSHHTGIPFPALSDPMEHRYAIFMT